MVQRKVVSNYKFTIQGNNTSSSNTPLKTEKIQANHPKPFFQNHQNDINISRGADFKAMKMKKSRSIKQSDVEIGLQLPLKKHDELFRHPGKPPPLFKPTSKRPSSSCVPNYMKSTSSFEARKVIGSNLSTLKQQKVAKTLTKTPSLKKVRSLKKAPSLKLKQPARTAAKTCSSAQKDAKFPPRLELKPGATEAKGKSVLRVCKYNHCSLNDHHHVSAPPLKRFLTSRRRLLITEKTHRPVVSPRKERLSKESGLGNQNEDFFVQIYVPDRVVDQQVSERLSDGPRSEIDLQDDGDQTEDTKLSEMNFAPEVEVSPSTPVQSDLLSVSLDENSGLEWEEGKILTTNESRDSEEIDIQNNYSNDQGKPGFDTEYSIDEYLDEGHEFHEYPPYFYDEIVEYLCLSDADSLTDSESTDTGEKDCTSEDEATVHATMLQEESTDTQGGSWSDLIEGITAAPDEDDSMIGRNLVFYEDPVETDSDKSNEDDCIIRETTEENSVNIPPQYTENLENSICTANNNDQGSTDQSEDGNYSSEVELESNEDNVVEVNSSARVGVSNNGESDSNLELLDSYDKLRKWMRCKKENEDAEKEREFNPRGPNFLDLEPEPEAEKVDLRHQEMEDRRNAEEWMLDHALQKTVNQLTPARKRKVALLVEAYETVLPVPKYELDTRRDSSIL